MDIRFNPERVCLKGEPLQGCSFVYKGSQGSRKLEPWAEISERLRRYFNGHGQSFLRARSVACSFRVLV